MSGQAPGRRPRPRRETRGTRAARRRRAAWAERGVACVAALAAAEAGQVPAPVRGRAAPPSRPRPPPESRPRWLVPVECPGEVVLTAHGAGYPSAARATRCHGSPPPNASATESGNQEAGVEPYSESVAGKVAPLHPYEARFSGNIVETNDPRVMSWKLKREYRIRRDPQLPRTCLQEMDIPQSAGGPDSEVRWDSPDIGTSTQPKYGTSLSNRKNFRRVEEVVSKKTKIVGYWLERGGIYTPLGVMNNFDSIGTLTVDSGRCHLVSVHAGLLTPYLFEFFFFPPFLSFSSFLSFRFYLFDPVFPFPKFL